MSNIQRKWSLLLPVTLILGSFLLSESLRFFFHIPYLSTFIDSLRISMALLFFITGTAHFGKLKQDMVRMVPPQIPYPEAVVFITGILELLGALFLLIPALSQWTAFALGIFLILIFPANIYAAQTGQKIAGKRHLNVIPRGIIQLVLIGICFLIKFS